MVEACGFPHTFNIALYSAAAAKLGSTPAMTRTTSKRTKKSKKPFGGVLEVRAS